MANDAINKTTKPCKHCGSEIPVKATRCPQCQGDLRSWFSRHPFLTIVLLLVTVPSLMAGIFSDGESPVNSNAPEAEQTLTPEEQAAWLASKPGQICAQHPEWTREDCRMLADRKIWVGMHYEMLKYMRGLPDSANPSNYGSGMRWQWCWNDYKPSCFYDRNDDGLIDSFN